MGGDTAFAGTSETGNIEIRNKNRKHLKGT